MSESSLSDDNEESAGDASDARDETAKPNDLADAESEVKNSDAVNEDAKTISEIEENIPPDNLFVKEVGTAIFDEATSDADSKEHNIPVELDGVNNSDTVGNLLTPEISPSGRKLSSSESRQGLKLHRQEALMSTGSHTSLETSCSVDTVASSPRALHPTGAGNSYCTRI